MIFTRLRTTLIVLLGNTLFVPISNEFFLSITNIVEFSARNSTCVMHPVMMLMVAWQNIEGVLSTSQFWEKIFRTIISQSRILELCVQAWGHIFLHQIEEGGIHKLCCVYNLTFLWGFTLRLVYIRGSS